MPEPETKRPWGRPRTYPEGEMIMIAVRVPRSIKEALDGTADRVGASPSDAMREAIEEWVAKRRKK